jgi:hypothetical protein
MLPQPTTRTRRGELVLDIGIKFFFAVWRILPPLPGLGRMGKNRENIGKLGLVGGLARNSPTNGPNKAANCQKKERNLLIDLVNRWVGSRG